MEDIGEKIQVLRKSIKRKQITYNWHESPVSYLEAVFARGDRRLCDVLVEAFKMGAKLDGWSEYFNFDIWTSAFEKCEVNGDFYAYRQRDYDEILPWDFIDVGVNKEYLIRENERAKLSQVTPDCRLGCENCGVNINLDGECFNGSVFNKIQQG
jgi:hypothetical protein